MSAIGTDTTTADGAKSSAADLLVERLFGATLATLELFSVHIGWRLGLYPILAADGPLTADRLAAAGGIDGRYAREWLEQQAAAGFLTVDDASAPVDERRYSMPAGHEDVLVDPESLAYVVPFAPMVVGIAGAVPEVVEAYRTGRGVPYSHYGKDFRDGQGAINRPAYHHQLAGWIAAMPDVDQALRATTGARVIDIGCGQGWSTIALARAYPNAEVVGVDIDPASIDDARANAAAAGVSPTLHLGDAGDIEGGSDLACIFESLHDMARPVDVLSRVRGLVRPGGAVLVVDERVGDQFSAPAGEVERMMYGWSVLHCLPACRTESPSAALGTVLRRPTVDELVSQAGYSRSTELDIDNDFFRFYRLDP